MDSTSFHKLNADKGLSLPGKPLWFFYNWLNNNYFPNAGSSDLTIRDFQADTSERNWSRIQPQSSPSRKLCDLFWLQLPWVSLKSELGQINVLDTGCGSGNYGTILQSYSGNSLASYTGLDIRPHDNWKVLTNTHPNFQFFAADSANMSSCFPETANLFISQSAIEHFEQDLRYFKQIREFIRSRREPAVQVHLFPSPACLALYLLHGVRQYTPRTISKVTNLFQEFSYSRLYRLGGRECNRTHWEYFTKPVLWKIAGGQNEMDRQQYDAKVRQAITADNQKTHDDPSFYALVIHSHWKTTIFG